MKYYLFNTGQYVENYVLWGDLRSNLIVRIIICHVFAWHFFVQKCKFV